MKMLIKKILAFISIERDSPLELNSLILSKLLSEWISYVKCFSQSVYHQLPELAQTHVHWFYDQPSHPLSSPSPPTFNLSQHQGLSNESVLPIRWPKYWSFSFSISPSNEYSGLISFRMDWLDLRAAQGTLKSLLQHHSSKASILQCLAFSMVQLSHPYMTTGKTLALTRWTFVGKAMSLLFNMLSRMVILFLPRSKCLFNFMTAWNSGGEKLFWGREAFYAGGVFLSLPHSR